MKTLTAKNVAAILLMICFVLPLSRCAKKEIRIDANGSTQITEKAKIEYNYLVPVKELTIKDLTSFVYVLPFFWPFLLWKAKSKQSRRLGKTLLGVLEFLLLAVSIYLVFVWTFYFGSPYWGGLIAISALIVLLINFLLPAAKSLSEIIRNKI